MTKRKKFWEEPNDPMACTEIMYKDEFLHIYDRQLKKWREPTPVETYLHFQKRNESFLRQDAESKIEVLEETIEELEIQVLQGLAAQVNRILKEELEKSEINYDLAEARMYNVKTVGVQGDKRTYLYPAEITLIHDSKVVWNEGFTERLSSRITNEIQGVNRVLYVFAVKNY